MSIVFVDICDDPKVLSELRDEAQNADYRGGPESDGQFMNGRSTGGQILVLSVRPRHERLVSGKMEAGGFFFEFGPSTAS